ncbi:hypothetical protein [Mycobacterium sp.]|uniref:hypothetical protein n=1 Tax=Mycobacterium sp. TaxID=1785 RepID=UPI002CD16DE0|nr:hypothetical protein [Mycobacterium sp.]HME49203.1 hypothetical protein [Mycobacterium sp.]
MRMVCRAGIDKPFLITIFALIAVAYLAALADADFEEMYSFGPVPFGSDVTGRL